MAAFYVISGQLDRYRAVDPDGPLLMAAHQATTRAERQALHVAMVRSGDLDMGHRPGWLPVMCASIDGHITLARWSTEIEVLDPIAVLARRPLGDTTPADLAVVEKAIAEPGEHRVELLQLIRACLHHRFGNEITLGSAAAGATDHDIALGGG
jgi:hypothetical protein